MKILLLFLLCVLGSQIVNKKKPKNRELGLSFFDSDSSEAKEKSP